ncbi:hypothetical protein SPCG_0533 [Streptococcus pneumoniae CGSP14]|nr:hypothetical protein SPCG_0533 [Streptococcus pneumoniae CGSP14]EFL67865.1 hypothetical protein CGSSp14BS292_07885 [Streptococcus pneumoniae SP14-BS292]EFL69217.1 hypothetical protein CGSSpBS293_01220 [Streptococcus pneumoniae SP-BS293]EFL71540.1 hypothetical protein CGSSpBS458_08711 [Streptococcus pneumoniae BS458]EFL73659.1 hypothetical protein CGSSpBS457_09907 [Streptococcus pneumoniae BS457]EFL76540.1 hypothetical protein CGSSpBS397_04852 [Streptococcus pneumoniae BS397]
MAGEPYKACKIEVLFTPYLLQTPQDYLTYKF